MIGTETRAQARLAVACAAVVGALLLLGLGTSAVTATTVSTVSGVAVAEGFAVNVTAEEYLVVEHARLTVPRAQARIDPLEGSRAFAGFPDIGEEAEALPPLLRGQTGLPVPDYPLTVHSVHPHMPEDRKEVGPVVLEARSEARRSAAYGAGALRGDDFSITELAGTARVAGGDGATVAEATTVAEGLNLADIVEIGRLVSYAEVERAADGTVERRSSLTATGASIAGQPVTLDLRSENPLAEDSPLREVLASAGLEIDVAPAVEHDDGVTASVLRIRLTRDVPNAPEPGVLVFEIGGAMAIAGHAQALGGPADTLLAESGAPLAARVDDDADAVMAPASGEVASSSQAPPAASGRASETDVPRTVMGRRIEASWGSVFPSLGVAALGLVGGLQAVRRLGGRQWTS